MFVGVHASRTTDWVVVSWSGDQVREAQHETLEAAVGDVPASATVVVDVPVHLPETRPSGGRECERAARRLLGQPRRTSIFPAPAAGSLLATSFEAAVTANRSFTENGRGISLQTWYGFPAMREVRDLRAKGRRLFEGHPELSFFEMVGRLPMRLNRSEQGGVEERGAALVRGGFPASAVSRLSTADLLEAAALTWTAMRIGTGAALRVPDHGSETTALWR